MLTHVVELDMRVGLLAVVPLFSPLLVLLHLLSLLELNRYMFVRFGAEISLLIQST